MEKNFDPKSMQDAMRIANSDAAQRLLATLQAQNPDALNTAMQNAASGDYSKVRESLSAMLASPQVQALLEQLKGQSDE